MALPPPRSTFGMQAYGRPSASENIAEGNAIASAGRAQATRATEAARTQALNAGTGQANSLGRISAFDQYQQGPSRLDAFHTTQPGTAAPIGQHAASMVPYNAGTTLSPEQGNAIFGAPVDPSAGPSHDAGLAAAGKGQLQMTPYGQIGSTLASPTDTARQGPSWTASNGVSSPGAVPFDPHAAQEQLRSNPAMKNVFVAGSPENTAFVNHYQQNGLQSAFENAASIVRNAQTPQNPSGAPNQPPAVQKQMPVAGAMAGALPMSAYQ